MTKKQIQKEIKKAVKAVKHDRISAQQADTIQRLLALALTALSYKGI